MPVVAGISYEMIRLAGRTQNPVIQALFRPGLWLQYLTTREPHADQIEVAIEAMNAAKPEDHEETPDGDTATVTITPAGPGRKMHPVPNRHKPGVL